MTVSFSARGPATWVSIVQTGWERLGAKGPEPRRRNLAGWSGLRPLYAAAFSE